MNGVYTLIGRRIDDKHIVFMMLLCQPNFTINVAPCFVLRANRSQVGILHNNGLRHSAPFYAYLPLPCTSSTLTPPRPKLLTPPPLELK
jgi:hypothetical protein